MAIKFIKSPTPKYGLAYSPGDVTDSLGKDLEKQLKECGYGVEPTAEELAKAKQPGKSATAKTGK